MPRGDSESSPTRRTVRTNQEESIEAATALELGRARALRSAMADMVFIISSTGVYTGFFPAHETEPLVPPELFLGRNVLDVMPPAVSKAAMAAIEEALSTQELKILTYELWEGDRFCRYECRVSPSGADEVLAVVRDVSANGFHQRRQERWRERDVLETRAQAAVEGDNPYALTFREFTVLDLMQQGLNDREIAQTLGLAAVRITDHVLSIVRKLGTRSRTEAAVRAIREDLIPDPY